MQIEKRSVMTAPELRADSGKRTVRGYAAVFNSRTDIGGYFFEQISPGAFADSLKTADVRALVDHDSGRVIGRSKAGTLRLEEDERGLAVEIDLPDTSDGRDLAELVARGDIDGMSFGFRVTHDEWDETGDIPVRTIHGVELHEVSAVTWPAYPDTDLGMRSRGHVEPKAKKVSAYFLRKALMAHKVRGI